tara:strand:- start:1469 stop:1912 length:444 start_codon:yes stop_codon:yes gene_type:complete
METVLFNTKEGFWENDQGYVYTDDSATLYDNEVSGVPKGYAIELYVPKGIIKHQGFEDFLNYTLAPMIANNRANVVSIFFHREMELEPSFNSAKDAAYIASAFEDATRDTIKRLCEQHTPILALKDDVDGFWFTTDKEIKLLLRGSV